MLYIINKFIKFDTNINYDFRVSISNSELNNPSFIVSIGVKFLDIV